MKDFLEKIETNSLACERGGRLVFRNLNFELTRGEALSMEGPNGAGKTSILRILAGLLPQREGVVRFRVGTRDVIDDEERARFVGWLGHQDGVKAQLTVTENAAFTAALYGSSRNVAAVLEQAGLGRVADFPGQYLSAGQRRRLALARLVLCDRPLWLLDEPLASLDTTGKRLTAELITAHCAAGGMVIAATHEPLGVSGPRFELGGA